MTPPPDVLAAMDEAFHAILDKAGIILCNIPSPAQTILNAASAQGYVLVRRETIREEREACAVIAEDLIRAAYNTGFQEGMNEVNLQRGGITWLDSNMKQRGAAAIRNRPETQG